MHEELKDQELEQIMSAMHDLSRPAEEFRQQLLQQTSEVIVGRAKRRNRSRSSMKWLARAIVALAAIAAFFALWHFGVFSFPPAHDPEEAGSHTAEQPKDGIQNPPRLREREPKVISGDDLQALIARLGGRVLEDAPDTPLAAGNYDPWQVVPLDELVRNSDLIIVAKVKQTKSSEFIHMKSGRKVVEDFTTVTIRKCFRGEYMTGDEVIVRSIRGTYSACGGGDPEFSGNENVLLFLRKDPQQATKRVYRSAVFFRGRAFQAKKFIVKSTDEIPQGKSAIYFDADGFKRLTQLVEKYKQTERAAHWRVNFKGFQLDGLQMTDEKLLVSATEFELHEGAKYYIFAVSHDGKIVSKAALSAPGKHQADTHVAVRAGKLTVRELFGEAERWSIELQRPWSDRVFLGDGIVLSVQPAAVHAFRLDDGQRQWMFDLPTDDGRVVDVPRPAFSPASVILKTRKWTGTTGQFRLYALDKQSGKVQWEADAAGNGSLHTPIILGNQLIDVSGGTTVRAYDTKTGAERWKSELHHLPTSTSAAGKSVLVATSDGQLQRLSPETGEEIWKHPVKLYGRWQKTPPLIHNSSVYLFTDDFRLLCLDVSSGEIQWELRASSTVRPVIDDETLYFLNENRQLYALDISKAKSLVKQIPNVLR